MTPEEIAEIFREMEDDLFKSMRRNVGRHEAWEEEEGFEWVQWQAEQINSLRAFREEIQDIVNATYSRATPEMEQALLDAYHEGEERAQEELTRLAGSRITQTFFGVTPKMRGMIENVLFDVERTRYAAINRMNSGYTAMLQKADIYFQSGSYTLKQAVDMASKDFVSAGLNCVEYSNGARVGIDSYVEMALRTSSRDASIFGEGSKRDEWDEHLVISNVINTTCPHCMKWQGKVLIDDVYSNGKPDGKHIRLSVAKANGFLHPNCRHKPRTFIEGVTKIPTQPDKAKTKEQYEAEQKQRYYERNIRKYKRLRDCSLDDENRAKYNDKVKEWSKALDKHIEDNPSLRKNPWRSSSRGTNNRIIADEGEKDEEFKLVDTIKKALDVEEQSFVVAKSKTEAEKYGKKFAKNVSYDGITLENANIINQRLDELTTKYPINKLDELGKTSKKTGIMSASYCRLNINGRSLKGLETEYNSFIANQEQTRINIKNIKARWANKSKIPWAIQNDIDKLENKLKFRRWGVHQIYSDHVRGVITHEYGHILSDQYFGMINHEKANPNYRINYSLRSHNDRFTLLFERAKRDGFIYHLSEYGSKNAREFFAECFTAREYGELLPDYLEDFFEETLRNGIL